VSVTESAELTDEQQTVVRMFDLSLTMFANTTPDAHLEGIVATMMSYRDFIEEYLETSESVSGEALADWIRDADRDKGSFPEPWGAELVTLFDRVLIKAVEEERVDPEVASQAFSYWVDESVAEITEKHDLPEGFFDVA
jgi:hypothetical protein